MCADNKLTCSPVLEEVILIFFRLKVGHSSELRRVGSLGWSTSSSRIAIDSGALWWSVGGRVHKLKDTLPNHSTTLWDGQWTLAPHSTRAGRDAGVPCLHKFLKIRSKIR